MSTSRKRAFWHFIATHPGADKAASQLTTSPSLSLSWPRPISIKSALSQTALILDDEAHSGSYHGSYGLTHARFTHRHRRHALPLHTCSNTTPPKHSPDQNGQGLPLGDPGSLWLATALGSSAAVSRSRHDSTPTASFEVRLVDLLWPQPPLACSSHQTSTLGSLSLVVAACVKDARPSRWRCYSGARSRQRRDTRSVESGRSRDAGRRGWRPVAGWWAESSQEDSRVASNTKQRASAQRAQTQL